jgi:predicted RND superfamily exporter protein
LLSTGIKFLDLIEEQQPCQLGEKLQPGKQQLLQDEVPQEGEEAELEEEGQEAEKQAEGEEVEQEVRHTGCGVKARKQHLKKSTRMSRSTLARLHLVMVLMMMIIDVLLL